ncbi:amino acid adenylation domain-containing protein [Pseudomonas sp. 15FMM2]|uniref:Amino acid adenylation domain-containing protein n=1 Tax=Pseudomonas imrae TaxID=2992837 RepID=A0ACC7PHR2_9PSED
MMDDNAAALKIAGRFILLPLEKRKVYLQKMLEEGISPANLPIPQTRASFEQVPLSFAQERQWFLWQLEPDSSAYHIPRALRLQGPLDLQALQASFNQLVARHEPLRTTFCDDQDKVHQVIHPAGEVFIEQTSLALGDDPAMRLARIRQAVDEETRRPFDLLEGPLMRVKLISLGEAEHVLVITQHHIVSDGWSMGLMVDELIACYTAASQGRALQLPALPIQYADYAIWQRRWMEAGERERQLAYWTAQLGDHQPVLELPTDYARPAVQSHRGARLDIALETALAERLKRLAQQHNASLFMVLLASFQALLYRYSGQPDIRVGVPVANRNRVESEGLIGFFVNTQVLKAQVQGSTPFLSLLLQVKDTALQAQDYQDLPFEQLVEALQPERSLSHSPLFQVMYNHQTLKQDARAEHFDLQVEALEWDVRTAHLDLTLDTVEGPQGLAATLIYATDLFDAATAERMAAHWLNLLHGLVADPQCAIAQLPMLGRQEQQALLRDWLPEQTAPLPWVHERITRQALTMPHAIALIFDERRVTFQQLDERANRLAHALIAQGVGPEVRVGIALPRSENLIVALLAVLKAGGAYVPLDVQYPRERLEYLMRDARIALLISDSQLQAQLPVPDGVAVLALDQLDVQVFASNAPRVELAADNLAYVIYTSGSTGQPKGVAVAHGPLAMHCVAIGERYAMTPDDCELHFMSFAFDGAHERWLTALTHGSRLLIRDDSLWTPEQTYQQMHRHGVTVAAFPPVYLQQLAEHALVQGNPPAVRIYCFGGDAVPHASFELVKHTLKPAHIINGYGPTETVVTPLIWKAGPEDSCDAAYAPIGSRIGRRRACVLDADLNLLPAGAKGELYLGGEGLARGYLDRPAATAERFVADPFDRSGGRLYRTGDLVCQRADGTFDYLGRIDNQVKIRGFRIELGEVESRLQALDDVADAVVIAQDGLSGKQLVAYVIAREGLGHDGLGEALRSQLKSLLPDYMVPAQVMFLAQFPLTPNGKLDRKGLPKPDFSTQQQQHYVAPRSELEQAIAGIWQTVLKLERVGLTDNFFELGGDSIISIQVVSRARQAGIRFTPKDLFLYQTVQGLAGVAQTGAAAQVIDQGPVIGASPLLPVQQEFFETDIPGRHHWNQSVLLRPIEPLAVEPLRQALAALIRHHDALRLNFVLEQGTWRASYRGHEVDTDGLLWQATLNQVSELQALGNEAQASLDLEHGPLLRAVLATLGDGSQRLLLIIHHLVVDGVSWRIIFDDLQSAYQQALKGQPCSLPAKTSAYRHWAERLQQYAHQPQQAAQLQAWQARLQDASPDLPCRDVDSVPRQGQTHTVQTRLDQGLTERLLQGAPAAYRTQVNDLLLSALAQVICQWTGQPSTLIQLEGHGRETLFDEIDLTRTVGWFTSVFPVNLTPGLQIADSIKQIKEQLRAIPDKGIGFGVLRYLADDATRQAVGALPVPRITFNYLGQFDGSFDDAQGALFVPASEDAGADHSPHAPLGNWLTLNGQVFAGELSLNWTFSDQRFDPRLVQRLADDYATQLQAVIEHCCQGAGQGVTPSDFNLVRLEQAQLDSLPMAAAQIEDIYPLSPMQQGMLFHSLYEQEQGHYINQLRLDVDGLDPERFRQAWQAMLDSHDILRTGFLWQGAFERPVQVVYKHAQVPFTVHDWRDHPQLESALDELARGERQQGFDLVRAPLLRLVLVRTEASRYQLIYTNHHVLMDGWSNSQLLGEVLQHYCSQSVVRQPGRFRDYIAWLQRQDSGASERFWKEQLANLTEPTHLARAIAHEADDEHRSGEHARLLDEAQTQRLSSFARQQKVTLNTLVQAAWLLILQRYTGKDTVAFGATVAGRPADLKGVEQQIGLFINTLPVIASLHPEQRLSAWLQQVQDTNLALREHEHSALFDIQRWSGLEGGALFDTLLVFENYPVSEVLRQGQPEGLSFGDVSVHEQTNYPLTLAVNLGQVLSLQMSYNCRYFSAQAIERLCGQLEHLLLQMSEAGDCPLGEIAILEVGERQQLVETWNATDVRYPHEYAVHKLFEAQVERTPQAIALVSGAQQLTYLQLNAQANRLSQRLIDRKVGPDVLVGIAMERSVEMVVGLLAILKAGGAYVPLDPDYPRERLAYMLEDSGVALLLTQGTVVQRLPLTQGLQALLLDELPDGDSDVDPGNPDVHVDPQNLAYVIYTSGSTGQPKGAGNRHVALSNRLYWMQQAYGLQGADCVLQKTPFSFDVSVWEFFWPLITGARLLMAAPGDHRDPAKLIELIVTHQVTTLHFVPSMLQAFLQDPAVERCSSLQRIVCSGEALALDTQQQVFARLPASRLYNLYGPTEAAIDVTHWTCRSENASNVPIGEPIANLRTYILDAELAPVAVGVTGELYLAGVGLARGYHRRGGLTAERFVASPFVPGERLYRTGDLCRHRPDGVIDYLGRSDHQVKIRGLRIELGEIESRLLEQPGVREAVVLAVDVKGGKRLVAYVVPNDEQLLGNPGGQVEFHQHLSEQLLRGLPDYMVPSQTLLLAKMPLSPNGKLDRKALPAVDSSALQASYQAPCDTTQRTLVDIWQAVLGLEQVGVTDNFFALGGDSIISIQVVSRARQAGLQISPKDLFEQPTIEQLAACCTVALPEDAAATPVARVLHGLSDAQRLALPLPHAQVEHLYRLSPMQQGMLFLGLNAPQDDMYVNQLSIDVHGLDSARFIKAWAAVCQRHSVLRTGFLWQDLEEPLQFVLKDLPVPLSELDWRDQDCCAQRLQALADAERERGFALESAPLQRIVLVRLGQDSYQLIWTYHHILIDGWSTSALMGELLAHYAGQTLPPPVPYHHYIGWLDAQDPVSAEGFWRRQLALLDEPTYLADAVASGEGRGHQALYTRLDASRTEQLKAFARTQQITLNTLVQGAWALLLSRYSGQRSVTFGATMAGRPASLAQSEQILGLFINTLPVIQSIEPGQSVGQWLRDLQRYNLQMREYEYTPLTDIQRWSGRNGQSLFDSIIVFENQPVDRTLREWSGESLRFGEMDSAGLTNFPMDLMVTLEEGLVIEYMFLREHFLESAVQVLRQDMEGLLLQLASDAARPLGEIGLPSAYVAPRAARLPAPALPLIHERIAHWAGEQGQQDALLFGERQMSFCLLEARANALAHGLIARGVGPEVRVGVALPRNAELIVALLAVLKAGGAYVPLDTHYPRERLSYLMQDSGIALLLTDTMTLPQLPVPPLLPVLALDSLDLRDLPQTAPVSGVQADNLAYVIYTSGSSGQPKGVAVSHGPLAMHCQAIGERYGMSSQDCELHFMSFAFDGAHERWLTTLSHGGRLLLRDDSLWTPEQTYQAMHRHGVTVAAFPPVYLQQLAEHAEVDGNPPAVRIYCFGGDAVPQASYDLARRTLKPQFIINGYGPTETVVTPLLWKASAQTECGAAYAPIGSCVGERHAYVLDQDLNPLPAGVAGELYLGGEGLARGYLDRAGQTAERFVADPFSLDGARLYRTGDLVRQRPDGVFDYLGRVDNQVKIRGFRIELGEIEARLLQAEGVAEAVVVARDGGSGKQLAAYVVQTDELIAPQQLCERLREYLKQSLPDYMVPTHLVVLERLPLTPNGKLDRKGLPAPDAMPGSQAYVAPRTELERALAEIWQKVLKVPQVGIHDSFFELGGDSILSLQVVAKARGLQSQGLRLKLRDLVQKPTIAQLTASQAPEPSAPSSLLALNSEVAQNLPLFCVHAGFGTVFDYEPLAKQLNGQRQVIAIGNRTLLDPTWRDESLQSMARDYVADVRLKQPHGPYHLAGWSLGGTLALLMAAELERQGQRVAFVGLVDSFVPMARVESDDWQEDLQQFLHVLLPSVRMDTVLALESAQAIRSVMDSAMAQVASQEPGASAYAALGGEELTNVFMVARRLKALSIQLQGCTPVTVAPMSWWTPGREAECQALASQIAQPLSDASVLRCGHFEIPRDETLVRSLQRALAALDTCGVPG